MAKRAGGMQLEVLHEFHPDTNIQKGDRLAAAVGRVSIIPVCNS